MYNILVTDDDKEIVEAISIYLTAEGYCVKKAYTGAQAVKACNETTIHLVLLDIMMPDMDGLHATAMLREQGHSMPILLLTAKSEDYDKVHGLNIGADDYITKPFVPTELIARVRSAIRRYTVLGSVVGVDANIFATGGLVIDDSKKEVTVDGLPAKTTPIEYKLLLFLIKNKGRVFSSGELYERVWNDAAIGADNIVAVHIHHLREKIEINPANPTYLKVVWGIGYKAEDIR